MRTLERARLITYTVSMSISIAPVTLKARHTDREGWSEVFMMATEIRQKGHCTKATFLGGGMAPHYCTAIKGEKRVIACHGQLVP